jgi:hypothetical protein
LSSVFDLIQCSLNNHRSLSISIRGVSRAGLLSKKLPVDSICTLVPMNFVVYDCIKSSIGTL